ncbi:MAG: hypothetical protein LR015_11450 [Verrucomicrobia bacterium]|nr:hypothetical protein [Verrucomicrobiota bacterium]
MSWKASNKGSFLSSPKGGAWKLLPTPSAHFYNTLYRMSTALKKAHCTFKQRGPKLQIDVTAKVQARLPLRAIETEIKRCIRANMRHQFNMTNVDPINIRITQISGQPMEKVANEESWEATESLESAPSNDGGVVEPLPEKK